MNKEKTQEINNKEITKELFAELIKRLESKEIYLQISIHDDKSLRLVYRDATPTIAIKIGEIFPGISHGYKKD
jgi:hypothetical protein